MAFNIFRKKDPVCGMKEEKGKGMKYGSNWFCSDNCKKKYLQKIKEQEKSGSEGGCCH